MDTDGYRPWRIGYKWLQAFLHALETWLQMVTVLGGLVTSSYTWLQTLICGGLVTNGYKPLIFGNMWIQIFTGHVYGDGYKHQGLKL